MCAAMIRVSSSFDDGDACAGPEQHRPPVEQQTQKPAHEAVGGAHDWRSYGRGRWRL